MKRKRAVTLALGVCLAMAASAGADVVAGQTYDFVPITAVAAASDFFMGKFEITQDQYSSLMGGAGGLVPQVNISFLQSAEFVNALNVAAGSTVAYNIIGGVVNPWGSGVYRDPVATYFMIDENEFKDGYHNGSAYQSYATPSGALPTGAEANYDVSGLGAPWAVGSGAVELNGTFDLMGNVTEFMENDTNWLYPAGSGTNHRFMGGSFMHGSYMLPYTFTYAYGAGGATTFTGLRVGTLVPEPATMSLLVLGGLAVLRRRRK